MMKMRAPFIFFVLSLPFLACGDNELGFLILLEALGNEQPLHSLTFTTRGTTNGMKVADVNDPGRVLRELQFTEACNASYTALLENQALDDAFTTYSTNYDQAMTTVGEGCVDSDSSTITCTLDGPIDGEAEYQSACTAAGGEMTTITFDLSCDVSLEGAPKSVLVDLPPVLFCIPASADFDSCEDDLEEVFQSFTDFRATFYEIALTAGGFSQVTCSAEEVGGSSDATTKGTGIASVAMMVFGILLIMFGY